MTEIMLGITVKIMLIIDSESDYYDWGMSLGIDKSIVYKRIKESYFDNNFYLEIEKDYGLATLLQFKTDCNKLQKISLHFEPTKTLSIYINFIGICGKLTPLYKVVKEVQWHTKYSSDVTYDFFYYYDFNELLQDLRTSKELKLSKKDLKKFIDNLNSPSWVHDRKTKLQIINEISSILEHNNWEMFFKTFNAPIIKINKPTYNKILNIQTNINLAEFNFGRIQDPLELFQEIAMYLTNDKTHMSTISDKDMRDKKGFDTKSFKKSPSKSWKLLKK